MPRVKAGPSMPSQTPECLYTLSEIDGALTTMAARINADFDAQSEPLVVMVLLKGALVTAGALLPKLTMPVEVDYIHASRYRENRAGQQIDWRAGPSVALAERRVLLVDDILDKGVTLQAVAEYCRDQGAQRVASAVLVQKVLPQAAVVEADYVALTVPDRYVYGFGMDNAELERNAPGIFAL